MRRPALAAALASIAFAMPPSAAAPVPWGVADEARIAAEAASWAPPDFKKQLAKHSRRLMQGVADAAAAASLAPGDPGHRDAAAKLGVSIVAWMWRHIGFDELVEDE